MYNMNDTQAFINKKFQDEDHKFVMKKTCEVDKSGLEKKRYTAMIEEGEKNVQKKRENEEKRTQKATEKIARLNLVTLIFDKSQIDLLKGPKLQDQVNAFRLAETKPTIPKNNVIRLVHLKKAAIKEAIDGFETGLWTLPTSPRIVNTPDNQSEQENDLDEGL
jgi:hypothetical protein